MEPRMLLWLHYLNSRIRPRVEFSARIRQFNEKMGPF